MDVKERKLDNEIWIRLVTREEIQRLKERYCGRQAPGEGRRRDIPRLAPEVVEKEESDR